jgi:hypothetical protein
MTNSDQSETMTKKCKSNETKKRVCFMAKGKRFHFQRARRRRACKRKAPVKRKATTSCAPVKRKTACGAQKAASCAKRSLTGRLRASNGRLMANVGAMGAAEQSSYRTPLPAGIGVIGAADAGGFRTPL